jgi:exodeoxyribonuclease VII large subunit
VSSSDSDKEQDQLGFLFEEPKAATRRIWSVGELVGEVRSHIESEYADVWVEGEISNLRPAPSGHLYFTLKDGESQLPVVLFRRQSQLLRFRPADGQQVLVRGKVSVYEQRGQMQLVAELLEPLGAGSLQLAFEQLKARLRAEGLFEPARKRPLPAFPRCVGIITSPTGAVIRDFLNIVGRRHAALRVLLFPAVVQGESAAAEVAAGILHFNQTRSADVIVIARGGGSLEDLAPFNSETLARAIAASELPVVSAVGHETDFTIADFVADLRAPTPSAAAELITEAQHKVEERIDLLWRRLERAGRYKLLQASERLGRLSIEAGLQRLRNAFERRQQRLDELSFRMEASWRALVQAGYDRLNHSSNRLMHQDASRRLLVLRERLQGLEGRMKRGEQTLTAAFVSRQRALEGRLLSLSPLAVLNRGYALVFNESGTLIKNASQAAEGDLLTARLAMGSLQSRVVATQPPSDQKKARRDTRPE